MSSCILNSKTPKLNETDCKQCFHPHRIGTETKIPSTCIHTFPPAETFAKTDLIVPGLGSVPVVHGDPKWLPPKVRAFVCEKALVMRPACIYICNGSVFEAQDLTDSLVKKGVLEKLKAYENVYLARTDPADTARVEKLTFVCTEDKNQTQAKRRSDQECELARWISAERLEEELKTRFPGAMRGRTMFVVPFSMGPIGGTKSVCAVQLTDSPYVVLNMRVVARIMTMKAMWFRISSSVWDSIGDGPFVRCVHSMGAKRPVMRQLVQGWACSPDRIFVAHRIPQYEVWSYGSGYGGNSLLGKKCLALRIGSHMGWKQGWLAEHAAILAITDPAGKETFICVSFPSGGGKTALATIVPALPGWQVKLLGDDIAWLRWGKDGQLYAAAPENGMFGIAATVRKDTGENIVKMVSKNALLVNAGSTSKGRFMWQGLEDTLEEGEIVTDWKGNKWTKDSKTTISHPNSRFTVYTDAAPNVHPKWDHPDGVPIAAYIWGTKRPDAMPLIYEAESWTHGVTMAAGMRTDPGTASDKKADGLVHDPMSMRPFMSYNFSQYVQHWLGMEKQGRKMPKLFHINWYRTATGEGKPIWPGYGENIRLLEWILKRCNSPAEGDIESSSIGGIPKNLNVQGLNVDLEKLLSVEKPFWRAEIDDLKSWFSAELGEETIPAVFKVLDKIANAVKS